MTGCRTKDIIKDQLPKKYDEVVFCPLTEIQVEVYKRILGMEAVQNMIRKDEPCECGRGKRCGKWGPTSVHFIKHWNSRRKECCHPFVAGDLFKYMSALIKVSNHLALILPGKPRYCRKRLGFLMFKFSQRIRTHLSR